MERKKYKRSIKENFSFVFELVKENKIKTIILSSFVLIAFLTGIIVAIKTKANYDNLGSLGVLCIGKNGVISASFFTRLLSMIFILLICFGCSFSKFLYPVAILFLSYRGYLLGINIVVIMAVNGIGGVISAVFIAFPCQIFALIVLSLFYLLFSISHNDWCRYGGTKVPNQKLKIIMFALIMLISICILEGILLALFSPRVILVI